MAKLYFDDQHLSILGTHAKRTNNYLHSSNQLLRTIQSRSFTMNAAMVNSLYDIQNACRNITDQVNRIDVFLQTSASQYQFMEHQLCASIQSMDHPINKTIQTLKADDVGALAQRKPSKFHPYFARNEADFIKGFNLGKLLDIFKKDKGLQGFYNFDLAGMQMQDKVGNMGIYGDVSVGHAEISGKFHIALKKEDIFDPSLQLNVGAKVALAHGIASVYYNRDWLGASVNASGELGSAEAKGKIVISKKGIDMEGEVGVAAAKGKVTGSLEIFGVKITATAQGEVGAVGIGGTFKAEDRSFEIGAKASCILGGGLNFKFDW